LAPRRGAADAELLDVLARVTERFGGRLVRIGAERLDVGDRLRDLELCRVRRGEGEVELGHPLVGARALHGVASSLGGSSSSRAFVVVVKAPHWESRSFKVVRPSAVREKYLRPGPCSPARHWVSTRPAVSRRPSKG